MELPVVAGHPDVDDREAEESTLAHRTLHPLLHRRDELSRDGTAHHGVDELEALAPFERLDPKVDDTELAVASGLLLVSTLRLSGGGDRLPVGGAELLRRDLDVELASQSFGGHRQVGVADPREDRLMGLVVAPHLDRRVLLLQAVQTRHQAVLVPAVFGRIAIDSIGSERRIGGSTTGEPFGARVSPVRTSPSLGTATMSPAIASEIGEALLPSIRCRRWRRSSVLLREFTRTASGRSVPESTSRREVPG